MLSTPARFSPPRKPPLRYNLYGASLGGPSRKDKTHFFFNYEGRRLTTAQTFIYNVPTAAEKLGDFSGSTTTIRDPETAARPPFPGNRIPTSRLDPIGSKLASFFPDPNVPGQSSGNANFRANATTRDN